MGGKDTASSSVQLPLAWGQRGLLMAWSRNDAVQDVQDLIPPILLVPPHPGQGPRPPASCRSTGRVESQPAAAAPACAAKRRMMPADTPAGMRQLHLWWKPGEITGATRGTDSVPAIRKLRITAGLHFLHIAKPSIPEIPRQARCKGTRSRRHLPSLSASICGPLTPQSLSPCQKAVI